MRISRDGIMPLAAAIAFGAIAWYSTGVITRTESIVVALENLPPLSRVGPQYVALRKIPVQAVHPRAYRRIEDVLGKRVLGPIADGQQILSDQLADPGQGMRKWTATGSVVMFIPIPLSRCMAGEMQTGDYVDLVFCSSETKTGITISKVVLSGVPVVGTQGHAQKRWDSSPEASGLHVVLSPEDAERVAFCLENGGLYACLSTLRTVRGTGTTLDTLLTTGSGSALGVPPK